MSYEYEHVEETILNVTQRGLFNTFAASTWSGSVNNITAAKVTPVLDAPVCEVTGTKVAANEGQLPDPPVTIIDTDGSSFTYAHTDSGTLNPGQTLQFNNFLASVWPGSATDVTHVHFMLVQNDAQEWQMRVRMHGTLTAATGGELPRGKRFRIKNVT